MRFEVFLALRIMLFAWLASTACASLPHARKTLPVGVSATNAELMAAAPARAAAPAGAGSSRSGKATDIPLDRIPSLAAQVLADPVGDAGLRVDLAFVGAAGQGVPDTMGAVGPTQYLVVLNSVVRSFNKNTGLQDGVLDLGLSAFFNSVRGQDIGAFDPKVRYDRLSGRWFVVALTKRVLLAVSNSGVLTPQTGWTFYAFAPDQVPPVATTGCAPDYPRMSTDAHAIYVVAEMQCPGTLQSLFVIRKSSVLGGGPMVVTAFRNQSFGTPVDNFDPLATMGYVMSATVNVGGSGGTGRYYYRVADPGGTPVLSPLIGYSSMANKTGVPWPVRHRGNNLESGVPDNYTGRMFLANSYSHSVPLRRGWLWVADVVGVDNTGRGTWEGNTATLNTRNGVRFVAVQNLDGSPPAQEGLLFTPSATNDLDQRNYWVPALMVSGQGHMLLGASAAGTNEYINAAVAGRLATDPPGTLRPPILYTSATTAFNADLEAAKDNTRRWGDYSNISLDPCDDMTMWAIQQFPVATSVWGVAVARVKAPPPPPAWTVTPRALPRNAASVNVTIAGTPTDGEGFYDPGPGFACRISAAAGGGINVNAVTYHSPTSITLNVSTVGASGANHAITVTNPDGQSVTIPSAVSLGSTPTDFDGDARSDIAVYRPSNGSWYVLRSSTAFVGGAGYSWGAAGDTPISGDYDGDGRADIAVYRPASAHWFILRSRTNFTTSVTYQWGSTGDQPVPSDYDGDGRTDIAIYRPSSGTWYILRSSTNFTGGAGYAWGAGADVPVPGDYDGDGRTDIAVYRPASAHWFILTSSSNYTAYSTYQWGATDDITVPGDYDGDGRSDIAIYRPSNGTWYILRSSTSFTAGLGYAWGASGDVPIVGDFDSDGGTDITVYRPGSAHWFILRSSSGYTLNSTYQWGSSGDIPIPIRP